ncbi:MAG: hypothetical protein CMQ41_15475 [Gammaproteobacteria bacterium]|nr:hypothetical protein [Gammaproteobacteria bacterium]|tara:strand:+ start:703 stop:1347 length:645 start_codon:yes stop_codon:yes gene_type:complete
MMGEKTQAEQLAEPFDDILIYQRSVGGRSFDYVAVAEYIARLNKVLGTGNWNYEILKCHVQPEYKDSVIAHVRVTANVDGQMAVKEAYGGAKVKMMKQGGVMDLGNDFKSASSDAFKKACQGFGIALHLARSEESLALDIEESYPVEGEHWQVFAENFKSLDDEKKNQFREWFKEQGFKDEKPNRSMDSDDFAQCQVEVIRLMMGGETIEGNYE